MTGSAPALPDRIRSRADFDHLLATATNYEERLPRRVARHTFDLDRMRALLASIGDPQRAIRTAHVAGSKGKGSVTRLVAQGLLAHRGPAGRVGAYTSPHLVALEERIAISGVPVGEDALARAADAVLPAVRRAHGSPDAPTFFEIMTAVAWAAFRDAGCSDVVLEVGLGGRLDATNVCRPAVTAITRIEREHTRLLGDTLAAIAREKAGILKPGVPAVTSAEGEALEAIRARAAEVGAPLGVLGVDFDVSAHPQPGPRLDLHLERDGRTRTLTLPLAGEHQAANAAVAFEMLRLLEVPEATIGRAFAHARLPGALEIVAARPRVIVDGAHTAASAHAAAEAFADHWPGVQPVLLLALLAEKDLAGVLAPLLARAAAVVVTQVATPRAVPAADLAEAVTDRFDGPVAVLDDPLEALARARAEAGPDGTVLVAGSIYLAGAVRAALVDPAA